LRRKIASLLEAGEADEILDEIRKIPTRRAAASLLALLCSSDPAIKRRAVAVLGILVAELAEENIDRFKNISEEDFAKMVERHAEIGIKKAEMEEYRDAIAAAIEDGGFEKWQTLVSEKNENSPLLEKITADNFDQFAEMHDLQNQAREIGDELGIGGPGVGMIGGEMGGKMGAKHGGDSDGKRGGGRHFQN